jgi:hypothetical protein
MKLKLCPTKTVQQSAYFAGLVSAEALLHGDIGTAELEKIILECSYVVSSHVSGAVRRDKHIRFATLIERMCPFVSPDQWNGIVEHCERLFA